MATLRELIGITQKYKPGLFDNADNVKCLKINVSRFPSSRSILFVGTMRDTKTKNEREAQIKFEVPEGEDVRDYVPRMGKDKVAVKSDSPFFKFAFGYNNKAAGALTGTLATFKRKGTGKPINPKNLPGLDKHLLALSKCLLDRGLIRS